jgi:hypothetical protein
VDDVLLEIVLRRLAESPLPEQATYLLLAAFDSEESLSAQLGGRGAKLPDEALPATAAVPSASVYLRSLTVSGFPGIGLAATARFRGCGLASIPEGQSSPAVSSGSKITSLSGQSCGSFDRISM